MRLLQGEIKGYMQTRIINEDNQKKTMKTFSSFNQHQAKVFSKISGSINLMHALQERNLKKKQGKRITLQRFSVRSYGV